MHVKEITTSTPTINTTNQIKAIRKIRNLTRKQLAHMLGHQNTTQICLWETGQKRPSLENALKLQIILDVRADQLFRQWMWKIEDRLKPKLLAYKVTYEPKPTH